MKSGNYMNPYLAGICLGLVLLASFFILGAGLGASGGIARLAASLEGALAPSHTRASAYFGAWGPDYLSYYLVFMFLGTILGGLLSALTARRFSLTVERGLAISPGLRLTLLFNRGSCRGLCQSVGPGVHFRPGPHRRRHAPERQPGFPGESLCRRLRHRLALPEAVA